MAYHFDREYMTAQIKIDCLLNRMDDGSLIWPVSGIIKTHLSHL